MQHTVYVTTNIIATTAISSADINGGTIDGTVIGGASAAAGAYTRPGQATIRALSQLGPGLRSTAPIVAPQFAQE